MPTPFHKPSRVPHCPVQGNYAKSRATASTAVTSATSTTKTNASADQGLNVSTSGDANAIGQLRQVKSVPSPFITPSGQPVPGYRSDRVRTASALIRGIEVMCWERVSIPQSTSPLLRALVAKVSEQLGLREAYAQRLLRQGPQRVESFPAYKVVDKACEEARATVMKLAMGQSDSGVGGVTTEAADLAQADELANLAASLVWVSMAGRLNAFLQLGWAHYCKRPGRQVKFNTVLAQAIHMLHFHDIWAMHLNSDPAVANILSDVWGWNKLRVRYATPDALKSPGHRLPAGYTKGDAGTRRGATELDELKDRIERNECNERRDRSEDSEISEWNTSVILTAVRTALSRLDAWYVCWSQA